MGYDHPTGERLTADYEHESVSIDAGKGCERTERFVEDMDDLVTID